MHQYTLCQTLFDNALSNSIHKKRKQCLTRFVSSLLNYNTTLSLTEIANSLDNELAYNKKTSLKHRIKATDTLLGNVAFTQDIHTIYKGLAAYFFSHHKQLIVLVDWSGACGLDYFVLQASVVGHGRSIPIYTEVHHKSEQENKVIHDAFLINLKAVIPALTHVTIITDAGFHRDWFNQVKTLGWDFIGRIYSRYKYKLKSANCWQSVSDISFPKAGRAIAIGAVELGKTKESVSGFLYTYKEKLSGKPHKKNVYPSHEKAHSDYFRQGWVIFSSLDRPAKEMVNFYKKRMQIEENFRDIKNERFGIGLRRNNSSGLVRITMLFFLATLVVILLWWFGLIVESKKQHYKYQANTIKTKRVISLVRLGRMATRDDPQLLTDISLLQVISLLYQSYTCFIQSGILYCT
ncbi:MAG: IS4 family transposase [Gammaproteobacteria bacterium]